MNPFTKSKESNFIQQFQEHIGTLLNQNQELKNNVSHLEGFPINKFADENSTVNASAENQKFRTNLADQSRIVENMGKDLNHLVDFASLFEQENKKLTNERESLLEYMEGLSRQLERFQREKRDTSYEHSRQNIRHTADHFIGAQDAEIKVQRLNEDLKEVSDLSSHLQQQLKLLAAENSRILEEAANLQNKCSRIQKEKAELERVDQFNRNELMKIRQQNLQLLQTNSEMSRRIQSLSEYEIQKTLFAEKDSFQETFDDFAEGQQDTDYSSPSKAK